MENIFSKLSLNNNSNFNGEKYKDVLKISYKSDFPIIKTNPTDDDNNESEGNKNYSLNVLYTGGIKTYVNNNSNSRGYTTDIGWGCMIRSSQTLLANTLNIIYKQNNINYDTQNLTEICKLFKDDYAFPFSIHNITTLGKTKFNVNIGDWFGPSVASQCIQSILKNNENKFINELICDCLVSIDSGTIFEDEVENAFVERDNHNTNKESSVLVLLCVRLGLEQINEDFYDSLLTLFDKKFVDKTEKNFNFVGIAGGKPFKSLYFFDVDNENNLIYSDPHYVTNYTTIANDDLELIKTFQDNKSLSFTNVKELDPSMCIGFTVKNMKGLQALKLLLKDNKIIRFGNKKKELELLENLNLDDCI
ncbi:hypothetical protein ACO0SA_004608 [Hanseniaspora valbyensis]